MIFITLSIDVGSEIESTPYDGCDSFVPVVPLSPDDDVGWVCSCSHPIDPMVSVCDSGPGSASEIFIRWVNLVRTTEVGH